MDYHLFKDEELVWNSNENLDYQKFLIRIEQKLANSKDFLG